MKGWTFTYDTYTGVRIKEHEAGPLSPRDAYKTIHDCRRAALDFLRVEETNVAERLERVREHLAALGKTIREET